MAYKKYPKFYRGGAGGKSQRKTYALTYSKRTMRKLPGNMGIVAEIKQFVGAYQTASAAGGADSANCSLLNTYDAAAAITGGISQGFADGNRIGKTIDIVEIGVFCMLRQRVPHNDQTCGTTIRTPRRFFVGIDEASNGTAQTGAIAIHETFCGARNPNTRSRIRQLASVLVVPYVDSVGKASLVANDMLHSSSYQFSYRKRFKKPVRTTYLNAGADAGALGTNVPYLFMYSHEKDVDLHYQVEAHWYVRYRDP